MDKPNEKAAEKKGGLIFYPVLLGAYAVIALTANNLNQMKLADGLRSLAAAVLFSAFIFLAAKLITRDWHRAGLWSAFLLLLFFTYGHVYQEIEGVKIAGLTLGRHRVLFPVWLALAGAGSWLILRKVRRPAGATRILNGLILVLLCVPLFQIGIYQIRAAQLKAQFSQAAAGQTVNPTPDRPDVYYIILDGYSRSDVIQKLYGYDNTPFLDGLRKLGFYIPDCAQSNYSQTALSLTSSLNMDYLNNLAGLVVSSQEHPDYQKYIQYVHHSQVFENFRKMGYQLVTFSTIFPLTDMPDADIYIDDRKNPLKQFDQRAGVSEFEVLFLRTTAARLWLESSKAFFEPLQKSLVSPDEQVYKRVQFQISQLELIPDIPGSKVVFAHIAAPHAPFVFTADGEYYLHEGQNEGYAPEIAYLNKRLLEIIPVILEKSAVPPVIIIQGDHGWHDDYRLPILNAYYFPEGGAESLYPTVTPVNTFRLVFNLYFNGDYPLLPDESFFSPIDYPMQLQKVPLSCLPGK